MNQEASENFPETNDSVGRLSEQRVSEVERMRVKIAAASLLALSLVVPVLVCGGPAFARGGGGGHGGGGHAGGGHAGGGHVGGGHTGGAHIGGAHIGGAHIGGAHIGGAHIGGAHIGGAHIGGAHIGGAHIGGAHAVHLGISHTPGRSIHSGIVHPHWYPHQPHVYTTFNGSHHFHYIQPNNIIPTPDIVTNYATIQAPAPPLPKLEVKNYGWPNAKLPRI